MNTGQDGNNTAFLIDASIFIFQAHFSPYIVCNDKDGEDLSAVYGFSQFLLQFLQKEVPRTVAVAMDDSLFSGFRHDLCSNYKSNRELPDENLARQLSACGELCEVLGLVKFSSKTYEADDIIGTLIRRLREGIAPRPVPVLSVGILTRDKDLAQLLHTETEFVWDYQANRKRYIEDVVQDFGIRPGQLPDYLGLVGDPVDNITGVPGIGPVKGRHLLQKFGDIDSIYSNLGSLGSLPLRGAAKLAQTLETHKELAYLSKKLATIVDDVRDTKELFSVIDLGGLTRRQADVDGLSKLLHREKFDVRFCDSMVRAAEKLNNSAALWD